MELWNEYEGRAIGGLFPLERLIRSEGRSAFFTTTASGTSTVIRLIESHFDEDEILARWSNVSDLHQPNLLTLLRFGQAMMDETSLVYVVLEPTEADLSQILCERPLTTVETREIATSLIPALQALHARGLVHEHIQPVNVLAVGEIVKLRSDCIRETPEGPAGEALLSRDTRDLATLLLQCLTLQRSPVIHPTSAPLPAPFREIIHNGLSGTWGLSQMAAALEAMAPQPSTRLAESSLGEAILPPPEALVSKGTARPLADSGAAVQGSLPKSPGGRSAAAFPGRAQGRIQVPLHQQASTFPRRFVLLAAAAVCLLVLAVYLIAHRGGSKDTASTQPASPATAAAPAVAPDAPTIQPDAPASASVPGAQARESWRVVAYTYNRQDQAAAKTRTLEQRFAAFHPAVFAPTGRAPFLVTLGGPLSRDAAFTLRDRLRRSGLPRDVYARIYSSHTR